ncbi:MAG: hypothetical protein Q8Q60_05385 [Candidatus Chromulinivorax sp.]|nr:hypothetical protein [Candidatus Chromulinivorax sp.]
MKKISALLTLGLIFYNATDVVIASDFNYIENTIFEDDDDDFAIDDSLNNISLENSNNFTFTRSFRSPADNAALIYTFFGFIDDNTAAQNALLNIPIYQQTSPIRNRPILEEPFTLPYGFDLRDNHAISFQFFFNVWSHKNFTKDSTSLGSYFLLGNPLRIAELEFIDDLFDGDNVANFAKALILFDPATVQENRMGGVFESHVIHNNTVLTVQLPVLYAERNLYLTPSQKAAISISSLGSMLTTDGVDENDFIYKHIVMDQFGIGDLKFKAMYEIHATDTFDIDLGGFVILPTATALKQGIIGVWFDQNNDRAYFDLATIDLSAPLTTQNQDDVANFFLAAIDKLSSNILNCPLGNNGHVVIAPSINFDWYFARNWRFSNDFSLQVPLPAQEQRFYQKIQSQAEFLNDYNVAFDAGATDPITFVNYVNAQLQDLLFPYVFPTMVFPGIVFNSTNQFAYEFNTCNFYIGSNFWYQGPEHLQSFPNIQNNQDFSYEYAQAAAASAAQEKLFAKVSYNCNSTNYSWSLSAYGDITVWNSGIGNDFTLGLSIDGKF